MHRRNLLKGGLATGLLAVVAPELILPEKKIWQLDQTMFRPRYGIRDIYEQDFITVDVTETGALPINPLGPWTIIRRGPDVTGAPYEEIVGYRPDVPSAGFRILVDAAMRDMDHAGGWRPGMSYERMIARDIAENIRRQDYLVESMGTAGPPERVLPGYGQSMAYASALPEVEEKQPEWGDWWR